MNTYYIGIDPGGTTGIAWYGNDGIKTAAIPITEVVTWLDLFLTDERLEGGQIACIAMEPFRTAGKLSSHGLATIDLVGQIKGWCFARGVEYVLYPPQSRKAWLPKIGERNDEPTQHQQDAKAHLKHLLKNRGINA